MAAKKNRPRRLAEKQRKRRTTSSSGDLNSTETRSSEAITVCWGVTLTVLFVCNLITIAAHYYVSVNPEADRTAIVGELMLLAGALVGSISLILLPIVYWVRTTPPPQGVSVFGACLAVSPILGLILKSMR